MALTYLFTMFLKKPLPCYKIRKAVLSEFDLRKDQKKGTTGILPIASLGDIDPKYLVYEEAPEMLPNSEQMLFKHSESTSSVRQNKHSSAKSTLKRSCLKTISASRTSAR